MALTFQDQNNQLLNNILEKDYYAKFRKGLSKIELFITAKCKSNCEYCYLKKNQNSLYPCEADNPTTILNNLKTFLDFYIEQKFCCGIDFFSGEWLTTPLGNSILELLYTTFKNVDKEYRPKFIIGADNMQFLKDEEATKIVEGWYEKFSELDIPFNLSASVEGKYCEYTRVFCDDEYYNKLFAFMEKYHSLAHPMVSSQNIDTWIENFDWWMDNAPYHIGHNVMMLEVRDNTWTDEKIQKLLEFVNHVSDRTFKETFHEDKKEFLKYILNMPNKYLQSPGYNNIGIPHANIDSGDDMIACSIGRNVFGIRLGDLAFMLCHRLAYPELIIGKYQIDENNKITTMVAENIEMLIFKQYTRHSTSPHCEQCLFSGMCVGPCLGNSYEIYKNPLIPAKQVCTMFKSKLLFLIQKYNAMGLFDLLPEIKDQIRPGYYTYLTTILNTLIKPNQSLEANNNEQ